MATHGPRARAGPRVEVRAKLRQVSPTSRREACHRARPPARDCRAAALTGCVRHPDGCFRNPDEVSEIRTGRMDAAHERAAKFLLCVAGRIRRSRLLFASWVTLADSVARRSLWMAAQHLALEP